MHLDVMVHGVRRVLGLTEDVLERQKMTEREEQILQWIEKNPMISQQELADLAGITRSSVGVHISNLMKKGAIAGKGYVLARSNFIAVIGGVNQDIGGTSFGEIIPEDSNPGKVTRSIGGVGHNIACNSSLLGLNVKFMSALGDDQFTSRFQDHCNRQGIDISACSRVSGATSASYLYVADAKGDMYVAIADMEIFNHVDIDYLRRIEPILDRAELIVVDTNIPEDSIKWIISNCQKPIFVDPVSTSKAYKLKGQLAGIHTIKPNKIETELLTGIKIIDDESLKAAGESLIDQGIKQAFISLGKDGLFYINDKESGKVPCIKAASVGSTGAGDALMAGLIWGFLNELSIRQMANIGVCTAAMATESLDTINYSITIEDAVERLKSAGRWY